MRWILERGGGGGPYPLEQPTPQPVVYATADTGGSCGAVSREGAGEGGGGEDWVIPLLRQRQWCEPYLDPGGGQRLLPTAVGFFPLLIK